MAQRMRDYCRMLRESLARAPRGGRDEGQPELLPIVVYNGSEHWTAQGAAVAEPPSPWSTAAKLALAPFRAWDYVLLSLELLLAAGDGSLAHLPLANRTAATLRLQAERTPAGLLARMREEWARFPSAADRTTREVLHTWTGALLAHMTDAESALPTVDELEGLEGGTEMATVSEARLGEWFEEVRAEHVALGMEQGIQRGMEEASNRNMPDGWHGCDVIRRSSSAHRQPSGWRTCSAPQSPPSRWNAWAIG